mgnify:CR=1 FL=1
MTGENTGDNPRRVLLKLSGEAFGGGKVGIDTSVIRRIAEEIVPAVQQAFRSPSLSVAATSSVARNFSRLVSIAPAATIWACWEL